MTHSLQALHELARHGAHIRAPVPFDLRHVTEAADREAIVLAVEGLGNGAPNGRLPHAGWAHEAQDLPLRGAPQPAHGDKLQDALLHVLQPIVVLVQHGLRMRDVQLLRAVAPPRHGREPLEVVARDVELAGGGLQAAQLGQLLVHHLAVLLRGVWPELLKLLLELAHQRGLVVLLQPELLLAVLHVLHQHVAPVVRADLPLHLPADVALQLHQLQLLLQQQQRGAHALRNVQLLQDALKCVRVGAGEEGADVREGAGVVQVDGAKLHEKLEVLVV
mmetsp:Transcript_21602/g.54383  ORF Transcript_21602/g.54383 Transcript_21602/m.54383 type:complete len:276 (-) Transcript_21602:598-1425(-)